MERVVVVRRAMRARKIKILGMRRKQGRVFLIEKAGRWAREGKERVLCIMILRCVFNIYHLT